jgi:hypothetical protein
MRVAVWAVLTAVLVGLMGNEDFEMEMAKVYRSVIESPPVRGEQR